MALNWNKIQGRSTNVEKTTSSLDWDKIQGRTQKIAQKIVSGKIKSLPKSTPVSKVQSILGEANKQASLPTIGNFNKSMAKQEAFTDKITGTTKEQRQQALIDAGKIQEKPSTLSQMERGFYNNVVIPMNEFNESVFYNTGKVLAKPVYKGLATLGNTILNKGLSADHIQKATDENFGRLDKATYKDTTASKIGQGVGNTAGYLGSATALASTGMSPWLAYGATSGAKTYGDTNDIADIAVDTGTGAAFGLLSGGITKGLGKVLPKATKLTTDIIKNAASGAAGMYGANATTGEIKNLYNLIRKRDVTAEDWLKPVWSTEAATMAIIGGITNGYKQTKMDLATAKAQLQSDIKSASENIANYQTQMNHPDASPEMRAKLQAKIQPKIQAEITKLASQKYLGQDKVLKQAIQELQAGNIVTATPKATLELPQIAGQLDRNMQNKVNKSVDDAISRVKGQKDIIPIRNVRADEGGVIKELTNVDVTGKPIIYDSDFVRHSINSGHMNAELESSRNQIPLSSDDFKNVPNLISNYDNIVKGTENREGQSIRLIKNTSDGETVLANVVPQNGVLKTKTMWKKDNRTNITNNSNPDLTSKTGVISNSTSDINIIPSDPKYVNNSMENIANRNRELQAKAYKELGPRNRYIKDIAVKLNDELRSLKKSVRASEELGTILDLGYDFGEVRKTFTDIISSPLKVIDETSGLESIVREMIGRDYEEKFEDIVYEDVFKTSQPTSNTQYIQNLENTPPTQQPKVMLPTQQELMNKLPTSEQLNYKTASKAKQYESRKTGTLINKITDTLDTTKIGNTKTLKNVASEIAKDIRSGTLDDTKLNSYVDQLYNEAIKVDTTYYDENKNIKNFIQSSKLYVPENIKTDIPDYGAFRGSNMGNLTLTSKPTDLKIDTLYQELNNMRPDMFPDNIVNQTDQLLKISEVVKDIKKVETNVGTYLDENWGKQYKQFAKQEINKAINTYKDDLAQVDKVTKEIMEKAKAKTTAVKLSENITADEIKEIYKQREYAEKQYEKAARKELLSQKDKVQVDRLLKGEITFEELPNNVNKGGIKKTYEAKKLLSEYDNTLKEIKQSIKNGRLYKAEELVKNSDNWKEKNILGGLRYSTETAERNIYDIVQDRTEADKIVKEFFEPIHSNEAKSTRKKNEIIDKINELNLSEKEQYKVTFPNEEGILKEHIVSEDSLVQLLGEKIITEDMVKESGADTEKIKKAVNVFKKIYNYLFEKINEVLIRNGYPPIEYIKDYFPHFEELKPDTILKKFLNYVGIETSNQELPTDLAGLSHTFRPGKKWVGNFLKRTGNKTVYDARKGMDRYLSAVCDVIYHTDDIQKLRALEDATRYKYSDEGTQAEIEAVRNNDTLDDTQKNQLLDDLFNRDKTKLSHFATWLRSYTDNLSGKKSIEDRNMEHQLGRAAYNTMKNVEGRVASNMIGANINSALTNFIPITQALGEVTNRSMLKSAWYVARNAAKSDKLIDRSDFLTNRRGTDRLSKTTLDKVSEKAGVLMNVIDEFTSETLVRAKYYDNIQAGMNEQDAIKNADKFAASVMADRSKGATPTAFNTKNPIAKLFSMFQLEVNNQYRYVFKDLPENVKTEAGNSVAKALFKILVATWIYGAIKEKITGYRSVTDPIDIVSDSIKDFTSDDVSTSQAIINSSERIVKELPFVGGLIGGGRIPISSAFPDGENLIKATTGLATNEMPANKAWSTLLTEFSKPATYLLLPTAGGQLKKAVEGISTVANGGSYGIDSEGKQTLKFPVDTKNMNIAEKAATYTKAALFGKYSLPTAQKYIDSNFKSLSSNRTEQYQEALKKGISADKFLEINNKVKKISPDGGKFLTSERKAKLVDILESYDLNDIQKGYLYSIFK